jgi:hypothetical protein
MANFSFSWCLVAAKVAYSDLTMKLYSPRVVQTCAYVEQYGKCSIAHYRSQAGLLQNAVLHWLDDKARSWGLTNNSRPNEDHNHGLSRVSTTSACSSHCKCGCSRTTCIKIRSKCCCTLAPFAICRSFLNKSFFGVRICGKSHVHRHAMYEHMWGNALGNIIQQQSWSQWNSNGDRHLIKTTLG